MPLLSLLAAPEQKPCAPSQQSGAATKQRSPLLSPLFWHHSPLTHQIFKRCVLQFKDDKDKPSLGGTLSDSPAPCPAFWAGPTGISFPEAAADGRRRQPVSSPLVAWQHQPAGGVWQAEEMAQEAAQTPSPEAVQRPLGSDRRRVSHGWCGPCPLPAGSELDALCRSQLLLIRP